MEIRLDRKKNRGNYLWTLNCCTQLLCPVRRIGCVSKACFASWQYCDWVYVCVHYRAKSACILGHTQILWEQSNHSPSVLPVQLQRDREQASCAERWAVRIWGAKSSGLITETLHWLHHMLVKGYMGTVWETIPHVCHISHIIKATTFTFFSLSVQNITSALLWLLLTVWLAQLSKCFIANFISDVNWYGGKWS